MTFKIQFLNPEFFWLLLVVPIACIWFILKKNKFNSTRLKVSPGNIYFNDLIHGKQVQNLENLVGDFILKRSIVLGSFDNRYSF